MELVTIGQFSKICLLSVKALRLYDELELLLPAFIDPRTGYRYYQPAQASRARAIALLRSLDLSLVDIRELLAENDPDRLRSRLETHHSTLTSRLRDHEYMLRRVEQLMKRGGLVNYDIEIKELEPTQVVGITLETSAEGISTDASKAYDRLFAGLAQDGVAPAGPPRLIYHEMGDEVWQIEACVPVAPGVPEGKGLQLHEMAGGRAATTLREGPYDELGIAWEELRKWFAAREHKTASQPYDVYLNDPSQVKDPAELKTELVWPIR